MNDYKVQIENTKNMFKRIQCLFLGVRLPRFELYLSCAVTVLCPAKTIEQLFVNVRNFALISTSSE